MSHQIVSDVYGVLRGLNRVTRECVKARERHIQHIWRNSSIKKVAINANSTVSNSSHNNSRSQNGNDIEKRTIEALQRTNMVLEGIKAFTSYLQTQDMKETQNHIPSFNLELDLPPEFSLPPDFPLDSNFSKSQDPVVLMPLQTDAILNEPTLQENQIDSYDTTMEAIIQQNSLAPPFKPLGAKETIPQLVPSARARRVPSSRIGRMISFGGLFAGLGVGTVAEVTRRTLGINESISENPLLTSANMERIVSTMCKVRGAALKIGQLLSIQDSELISPTLQNAFERVRQSADFMPTYQVEGVLKKELGDSWRTKFEEFDIKPFAAASIGQVHWGKLHDGTEVAVKIQYPGVAAGINSDIENLVSVLNIWNVFPPGMFIEKLVEVAKKELAWEVDYVREADCTQQFRNLLEPYRDYYVPRVINELSTGQVFTSELIDGFSVDKAIELDLETRNRICSLIMHLCLKELFVFRVMQTDPNWSNFFYNKKTRQLVLLDFGATRKYDKGFIDQYLEVIKSAADRDRGRVLSLSRKMGFLTGYESKVMEEAHVDTVMILGEVFSESAGVFDFEKQSTVRRVSGYVPTMLNHRLCPPPEEIFSIHRKISGVFLLCSKLKAKISCRPMFMDIYNNYQFD